MKRTELDALKTKIVGLKETHKNWNDVEKVKARYDELGKVIQTLEGDGSIQDTYKGWKVGMTVESGMWYYTEDGYLWQAIKSGSPTSSTDKEYFDVVGLD